mgnify:CR=1 FL=1
MTENEAKDLISRMELGKSFYSRFEQNEWGIKYKGENQFVLWSKMIDFFKQTDVSDETSGEYKEDIKTENQLIEILMVNYDYKTLLSGLKDSSV